MKFLGDLGHSVARSPQAFDDIDAETFLFGVHLYRPVYEQALSRCLPKVFVGTGWDVWSVFIDGDANWESMEVMERTFDRSVFPQDGGFTTFSSTCLYWNKDETSQLPST
jgi:hypothetical protein